MAHKPSKVKIERIGGFAGFGETLRVKSERTVDLADLPQGERDQVEDLIDGKPIKGDARKGADLFRYRLSWENDDGKEESVECDDVPDWLARSIVDEVIPPKK